MTKKQMAKFLNSALTYLEGLRADGAFPKKLISSQAASFSVSVVTMGLLPSTTVYKVNNEDLCKATFEVLKGTFDNNHKEELTAHKIYTLLDYARGNIGNTAEKRQQVTAALIALKLALRTYADKGGEN